MSYRAMVFMNCLQLIENNELDFDRFYNRIEDKQAFEIVRKSLKTPEQASMGLEYTEQLEFLVQKLLEKRSEKSI